VEDPRLPDFFAMDGNVFGEKRHIAVASRGKQGWGFGWCVAKPPTEPRGMPLRNSTAAITFFHAGDRRARKGSAVKLHVEAAILSIADLYGGGVLAGAAKRNSPRQ